MVKFLGLLLLAAPGAAFALTPEQILTPPCRADLNHCAASQGFQFYMGGVLDAVAHYQEALAEAGEPPLYCREAAELFDMTSILKHLAQLPPEIAKRNTTAGVLDYLAKNGGCKN